MIKDLSDFSFVFEQPIEWGDMDAFGHINNVRFFRYFENARIAYLNKIHYKMMQANSGISIILGYINCKFIRPLFHPDNIKIGIKVSNIGKDRFDIDYAIFSNSQGVIVAVGSSTIVTYDYNNNCKADIPQEFRKLLSNDGAIAC